MTTDTALMDPAGWMGDRAVDRLAVQGHRFDALLHPVRIPDFDLVRRAAPLTRDVEAFPNGLGCRDRRRGPANSVRMPRMYRVAAVYIQPAVPVSQG